MESIGNQMGTPDIQSPHEPPLIPRVLSVSTSIDGAEIELARSPIFVERTDECRIQVKFIPASTAVQSCVIAVDICFAGELFPMELIVCGTKGQSQDPFTHTIVNANRTTQGGIVIPKL